jgi:maltooligosyltrehalose trehalohydrolase
LPVGAEVLRGGGVNFRVWAPKRRTVQAVVFDDVSDREPNATIELAREANGYFSGTAAEATPGMRYGFRLDGDTRIMPDPAARFQPLGPLGLSQIVDPHGFGWTDADWKGVSIEGQVIYEMHIGAFTPEGTWEAACARLPDLAATGMTVVELMPVADFPGSFGWGYDGVCQFAPMRLYGPPDEFRRFVDRAHAFRMGVLLDVVYNHFGTFECSVSDYSDDYYSTRYENEWGAPINFDGDNSIPVREFFIANARYWIEEFHLDGFRFDATQSIYDASQRHILEELQSNAREAASPRSIIIIAENEPQDVRVVRPADAGGFGFDALCNDDFHHSARVRLTGLTEAYYSDYFGSVGELCSAIKESFLYQGQVSRHQGKRRGTSTRGLPATTFVHFLQNHDQIANTGNGTRIHTLTSPGRLRAMTALWLLSPQTPMFFQGQEFSSSRPFLYFCDVQGEDGRKVAAGRDNFLAQFPSLDTAEARKGRPLPSDRATFERCKLDWAEREQNRHSLALHRDLLRLRADDPIFRRQRSDLLEAAALNSDCLAVRYFDDAHDDRLVLVNFGRQFLYSPSPLPALASPAGYYWELLWSSESVQYGGSGTPRVETADGWRVPPEAAVVLRTQLLAETNAAAFVPGAE